MIAALFVAKGGCYFGLPDVDPWDEARDARMYTGMWPVVAHPPCARWGRFATGAFGNHFDTKRGEDGGCFASALSSVRMFGGVLEHPASSHAWRMHGLLDPKPGAGWQPAGDLIGWTCHVEQGHFGHPMRKATWLYAVTYRARLPELPWGPSSPDGFCSAPHSKSRHGLDASRRYSYARLSSRQRAATPVAFRDVLLGIARTALAVAA